MPEPSREIQPCRVCGDNSRWPEYVLFDFGAVCAVCLAKAQNSLRLLNTADETHLH